MFTGSLPRIVVVQIRAASTLHFYLGRIMNLLLLDHRSRVHNSVVSLNILVNCPPTLPVPICDTVLSMKAWQNSLTSDKDPIKASPQTASTRTVSLCFLSPGYLSRSRCVLTRTTPPTPSAI